MMEEIVVTEDDLRQLEKRFGSAVRLMGSWNSDGTFGYASVPLSAVRRAAEGLMNLDVVATLSRLKHMPERTTAFLGLLNTFGSPLIAAIVAAYRECSPERMKNSRAASLPANAAEPRPLVRTAAGSPDPTLSPSATRTTGASRVPLQYANSPAPGPTFLFRSCWCFSTCRVRR